MAILVQARRPRGNGRPVSRRASDQDQAARAEPVGGDGRGGQAGLAGEQAAGQSAGAPEGAGQDEIAEAGCFLCNMHGRSLRFDFCDKGMGRGSGTTSPCSSVVQHVQLSCAPPRVGPLGRTRRLSRPAQKRGGEIE